jgi:hypothetical protein
MNTTDISACLGAEVLAGARWDMVYYFDTVLDLEKHGLECKPEERYKAVCDSMLVEYKPFTKERTALAGFGGGG